MYILQTLPSFAARAKILAAGASLLAITAVPVAAQEGEFPSNKDQHPGEIVYSRDVPYGTATRRISQGQASTVAPDQSKLILETMLIGLEPMSDADQAGVTAPLSRTLNVANQAVSIGLTPVTGPQSSGDFTRSESGASSTGGIVRSGLSVLPSALSVISRTAGRGQ